MHDATLPKPRYHQRPAPFLPACLAAIAAAILPIVFAAQLLYGWTA